VSNINESGGVEAIVTAGVLDSGSLPAGSILQVVRGTQDTNVTTTSTSYDDANLDVSITPISTSSIVLIFCTFQIFLEAGSPMRGSFRLANGSNVALSGAENFLIGLGGAQSNFHAQSLTGYDAPSSISAQTYKLQFESDAGDVVTIAHSRSTGQIIAMEVAA
jgi:hypothetical protein